MLVLFPCSFQLSIWYKELQESLRSNNLSETVDGAEKDLAEFEHQRDITVDASVNTISIGQNLIDQLRWVLFAIFDLTSYCTLVANEVLW